MKRLTKDAVTALFTRFERTLGLRVPPVTVLAYHAVSDEHTHVDVTIADFKRQLAILHDTCTFITIDQVLSYIDGTVRFDRPAVAITFDDAYRDVFTTAAPILARHNIPASVFAVSDPNNVNRAELANDKPLMTTRELKTLHELGWIIGSHSATHAFFGDPRLNQHHEIARSKTVLEQELGIPIQYFVYPKGIYSPRITHAVARAGYRAGFAYEAGYINAKTDRYTIPRMPVDWTHTEEQFRAFFTNWGVGYLKVRHEVEKQFGII